MKTVRRSFRGRGASVPLSALRVGLLVALAVALFVLAWWMFAYRINRTGEIRRGSFNFQETAREQVVRYGVDLARIDVQVADPAITDAQARALNAQRAAIAADLCERAADIVGDTTPRVAEIIDKECPSS